ncbi:hypothetical protein [Streptomyces sp. NK08204]|uniref:hypothetical protein n=1 Tax=Streptomyces sp. NK08204 TaxID=2873260 RepID=UPI001CECC004|nr:hypothetical protein [Streptomyces sp. NK08204]
MDLVRCLNVIDLLCAQEFPRAHGRTEHGESGPGYHIAALRTSGDFWEDDGTERAETEAQFDADRDGLAQRLTERWGPPQRFSLYSVLRRAMQGEQVEQPWAALSEHVPDVHLWQAPGPGRWVALGVSQWDKELEFQLLAVVTETDPP